MLVSTQYLRNVVYLLKNFKELVTFLKLLSLNKYNYKNHSNLVLIFNVKW